MDDERRDSMDLESADTIEARWQETGKLLPPLDMPKGVHKFRSIEEMKAVKEKYRQERAERLRAELLKK